MNECLEHHGVKGMKWGVRKKRVESSNTVRSDRKSAYKNRRTMSDEELIKRIGRLQLEKQFRDLNEDDLFRGKKIARDIMIGVGSQTLKTIGTGAVLYTGKVLMTKEFSPREAAEYIVPKPKKK